jgi:2-polyprenyl-6-methoxyphenol hydroxylase-like FAD-dependent oxidoreductase
MTKIVIIGGGVSGLVASYVFRQHPGLDVMVLEEKSVGGEFLAGGLKYIHHTEEMVELFDALDLVHSNFIVNGGILLQDVVRPYPKCFSEMDKERVAQIQADHWRKTRRSEPGPEARKSMNDPASTKPRQAIRCNYRDMINALAKGALLCKASVEKIETGRLLTTTGVAVPYDFLIVTNPLWSLREMANFYVPEGVAMALNVAVIDARRDRYTRWDYVYTPYTPDNAVHRFSPAGGGYAVEGNGAFRGLAFTSDLNFLFPEGWCLVSFKEGLKGHLLPLDMGADWPPNVAPLGRFAQWDARATMDVVLLEARKLLKRWIG